MRKSVLVVIVVVVLIAAGIGGYFGYVLTHQQKTNLPTMDITALSPLNALNTYQLGVIVDGLKAMGIPAKISLVTASIEGTFTTPQSTPQFMDLAWFPDWPDPIAQQLYPMTSYANGGAFAANLAWTTNATLNSSIALSTAFMTNATAQMNEFVNLYHTFYDQYNYIWMPNPSTYFFVQPYINNFTYNPYENYFYNMMSYNMSYDVNGVKAPSTSTLTDVADGNSLLAPDYLDPSHGFYIQDEPLFTAVFQQLYELNGSNYNQVVPVLASGMPTVPPGGVPFQNYNITLRSGITFSNGNPVNASTVWFSYYRTLVMAQGPSVDNYGGMLFNSSAYAATAPYSIPFGWLHDVRAAYNATSASYLKMPFPSNYSNLNKSNTVFAANLLANVLSHYDPWANSTQAKLLEYSNQAVAVPGFSTNPGTLNFTINLVNPYRFFLADEAAFWGNIADPSFIDAHDGVTATLSNNYTNINGMVGTGPYSITTVGASLDTISLTAVSNYWGNAYWNNATGKASVAGFPAVAQPAHIKNIVLDYTISHDGRVSGFLDNSYQISVVSVSYIGSIEKASPYGSITTTDYFKDVGANPAVYYVSMNNYKFPTNIVDFRKAVWFSVNQTAMDSPYYYNGTYLAENYIGPASPTFANFYDNATRGLAPEAYNVPLAEHYLNLAGIQGKFFVTLPNGTKLGDTSLASSSITIVSQGILTVGLLAQNMMMAVVKVY